MICVAILLSGCSTSSTKDDKEVRVSVATEFNVKQLDAQGFEVPMAVYSAIYQPLVKYGKNGKILPGLAKSWSVSKNNTSYTFNLRKNVKFNDGSELNAEAVKFSIERAKATDKTEPMETLTQLKSVDVINQHTVRLNMKRPSNQVLPELTQMRPLRIMSPHAVEGGKTTGKFEKAIGTGPFKVSDATNEKVTLKPNPYYRNNHPLDYNLVFQNIEDSDSRHLAIQSQSIDITGGALGKLTPQQLKEAERNKTLKVDRSPSTETQFMGFNPETKLLQNNKMRGAISLGINPKHLSDKQLNGLFRDRVKYVNEDNTSPHTYQPKKAQRLIEQLGYKKNDNGYFEKDGHTLSFKLVLQTDEFPEWKNKAEIIQQDLKRIGIGLDVDILDSQTYYETLTTRKNYDLIFYRTYTDSLMPFKFLNAQFKQVDGQHAPFADDQKLTKMLTQFPTLTNERKQQDMFNRISQRLDNQHLVIPIDYPDETFVVGPNIQRFDFSGQSDGPINYDTLKVKSDE